MASFSINDFKSNLPLGGVRPTLFQVQVTNPADSSALAVTPFRIIAASLPASNLGDIQLYYYGRPIHYGGDRTFDPWDVTVLDDEDFLVRNSLENWSNQINQLQQNQRLLANYKATLQVTQFSKTGNALRTYIMEGAYPQQVAAIPLDYRQTDTVENFNVRFVYDDWFPQGTSVTNITP